MEKIVADALAKAGIKFLTNDGGGNPSGLDFYVPHLDVHIEVKQFHTPRIAEQMSRAPNVIALQGEMAVRFFAALISRQ